MPVKSPSLGAWGSENISCEMGEIVRKGAAGQAFVDYAKKLRLEKEGAPSHLDKEASSRKGEAQRHKNRAPRYGN